MPTSILLDPELAAALAQTPAGVSSLLDFNDMAASRARMVASRPVVPVPAGATSEDRVVPGPEGSPDLRVRIYRPVGVTTTLPAIYWIHGGGMVIGTLDMDNERLGSWAQEVGCVGVSVDYRLAPENPHPAPVEDCYAGLVWTAKHASELGIDPARIAIGGASAGSGLAAATALLARDRGGPALAFQLLIYPMLDDRNITPSSHEITAVGVWDRATNISGWKALLGDAAGTEGVSPYAAPARAVDLSGLPPAYVDVGTADLFRDEDIDYAGRLMRAGVLTELHVYPGAYHGFEGRAPGAAVSLAARALRTNALMRALHG